MGLGQGARAHPIAALLRLSALMAVGALLRVALLLAVGALLRVDLLGVATLLRVGLLLALLVALWVALLLLVALLVALLRVPLLRIALLPVAARLHRHLAMRRARSRRPPCATRGAEPFTGKYRSTDALTTSVRWMYLPNARV